MKKARKRYHKRCIYCQQTESWYRRKLKKGWWGGCQETYDRKHKFEIVPPREERYKTENMKLKLVDPKGEYKPISVGFYELSEDVRARFNLMQRRGK